ncbi:MAG: FKBP-type peptidyl-prolyl cis-trans isomerase [Tannerella sp.]|jgi:FKBP-type peptidyl-prolyl cis-trans isomerase SlyD|nr:FKBP-type peptidyl-prolyl cis-trans isomerase [Tannerella sp.]
MRISKNKFISVTYDLHVGDDEEERELMESATKESPLNFIFGIGAMLPFFEEKISGLETGSKFEFSLTPENGYGEYNEDHLVDLPRSIFEVNGKFDDEYIKEGVTLPMVNSNGERMNGSVIEIKDDVIVMDFNHPLAGETLHFSGEILDVHEPTEAEIAEMNETMGGGCGCCGNGCDDCCDEDGCCDDDDGCCCEKK